MTDSRIEMIKFVLAFIALILVILGIYTYSNQDAKKTVPTSSSVAKVTQKVEVEETEEVLPQAQAQEVKAKKSSVKNITVKSPEVVSHETSYEMVDEEEIGKGLTLEGIENADVSDEEKEVMRNDLVYYQGLQVKPSEPTTDEEMRNIIIEDLKSGLIK